MKILRSSLAFLMTLCVFLLTSFPAVGDEPAEEPAVASLAAAEGAGPWSRVSETIMIRYQVRNEERRSDWETPRRLEPVVGEETMHLEWRVRTRGQDDPELGSTVELAYPEDSEHPGAGRTLRVDVTSPGMVLEDGEANLTDDEKALVLQDARYLARLFSFLSFLDANSRADGVQVALPASYNPVLLHSEGTADLRLTYEKPSLDVKVFKVDGDASWHPFEEGDGQAQARGQVLLAENHGRLETEVTLVSEHAQNMPSLQGWHSLSSNGEMQIRRTIEIVLEQQVDPPPSDIDG